MSLLSRIKEKEMEKKKQEEAVNQRKNEAIRQLVGNGTVPRYETKEQMEERLNTLKTAANLIYEIIYKSCVYDGNKLDVRDLTAAVGALSGYVCQATVWQNSVIDMKWSPQMVFARVETKNGKRYYFGDFINAFLLEDKNSIWENTKFLYEKIFESSEVPDITPIISKVAKSVGDESYKIEGRVEPDKYVVVTHGRWRVAKAIFDKLNIKAQDWPMVCNYIIENVMQFVKDKMEPELFVSILMEFAICISKMDIVKEALNIDIG